VITEPLSADSRSIDALVGRLAGLLQYGGDTLSAGDVAALRRMDPTRPAAAFFKLTGVALNEELGAGSAREEMETRWASIVVGLAHLGGLHRSGARLGQALANSGFSELRFSRLLRADAPRLVDELPTLAMFLTAKAVPVDWAGAAWLILSAGRSDEETTRRRLARDYYRALATKLIT
jgi:CRISPR type I-E-associated protein CasB/Cse2